MRKIARIMRQKIYQRPASERGPESNLHIEILDITHENVDRVLEFRSVKHAALFTTYLAEGRRGVFALLAGRVVGHAWASAPGSSARALNGYFRLLRTDSLIHYCNVLEEARGQGIYGSMIEALSKRIVADGVTTRMLIDTAANNLASIRGIEKAGFSDSYDAWFVIVGRSLVLRWQHA